MIILEGPDNAGKSTLAARLSQLLQLPVQGSEGPPRYDGEMEERLARYSTYPPMIFDRHPIISQPIYCKLRNGDPGFNVKYWTTWLYWMNKPVIIYCDPLDRGLEGHKRNTVDTDEHLKQIEDNYRQLLDAYRSWAIEHAHFIYRIGDDAGPIMNAVSSRGFFEDIEDFHRNFDLAYDGPPRELPEDLTHFRVKFMVEELGEYVDPTANWSRVADMITEELGISDSPAGLEHKLDALVDLVYVALGTAHLHGFNFNEAWRRVHTANMKKVRAERVEDSKRGSVAYDVVKPPGWSPPDLSDLV